VFTNAAYCNNPAPSRVDALQQFQEFRIRYTLSNSVTIEKDKECDIKSGTGKPNMIIRYEKGEGKESSTSPSSAY